MTKSTADCALSADSVNIGSMTKSTAGDALNLRYQNISYENSNENESSGMKSIREKRRLHSSSHGQSRKIITIGSCNEYSSIRQRIQEISYAAIYTKRNGNVFLSIIECMLFSAIPIGWTSLVFVFKEIGLYADMCSRNGTTELPEACPKQEERLNMFFSIAVATYVIAGIAISILLQKLGTSKTRIIFICIYPCGLVLLSYTNIDNPWLFLPGFILTGLSGQALIVTDMEVVFHIKKGKAFYLTVLNGAIDSSAFVLLIVKILYKRGVEMKYTFWGIAAVQVVVTLTNTFLHWKQSKINPARLNDERIVDEGCSDIPVKHELERGKDIPTFRQSVSTLVFGVYIVWAFFLLLRFVSFLGLANRQLSVVLDSEAMVSELTNILSYFLFSGLLVSIVIGGCLQYLKRLFKGRPDAYSRKVYPLAIALSVCCTLSIVVSTLGIVQSAYTFYAEFAVIPLFRSLFFSTNMNYVVTMFHRKWISTIMSISFAVAGLATIAQYFIFRWVVEYNAFQQMNYMMLTMSFISYALPCMLLLKRRGNTTKFVSQN